MKGFDSYQLSNEKILDYKRHAYTGHWTLGAYLVSLVFLVLLPPAGVPPFLLNY
jgi:hypothetical protein